MPATGAVQNEGQHLVLLDSFVILVYNVVRCNYRFTF